MVGLWQSTGKLAAHVYSIRIRIRPLERAEYSFGRIVKFTIWYISNYSDTILCEWYWSNSLLYFFRPGVAFDQSGHEAYHTLFLIHQMRVTGKIKKTYYLGWHSWQHIINVQRPRCTCMGLKYLSFISASVIFQSGIFQPCTCVLWFPVMHFQSPAQMTTARATSSADASAF